MIRQALKAGRAGDWSELHAIQDWTISEGHGADSVEEHGLPEADHRASRAGRGHTVVRVPSLSSVSPLEDIRWVSAKHGKKQRNVPRVRPARLEKSGTVYWSYRTARTAAM